MKMCSKWLVSHTVRCYNTHNRMATVKRLAVPRTNEEAEQLELLHITEGIIHWYIHLEKLIGSIHYTYTP